ncbi:efflux RND transporter permease subunit [Motiliproteus sp. SC1-56]|uniref:efflux RND transporter permease subunit n=1 Tax=Motiliproteus sp. SC1-56 TaxID=2799565 RepID=UPI001A8C2B4C|nr:efflux RND transporter permease subunit [Motiliproteus sp. SC1-56]
MTRPSGMLHGFIRLFATHRVAANLLMFLMILAGSYGIKKLNTQFFPTFELDIITIQVIWSGAAAEDVQRNITIPIEQELKSVNHVDRILSTSNQGVASLRLELDEGADTGEVLDQVKQKIDGIRNLPQDAEEPVVQQITRYETIASVVISSNDSLEELRPLARRLERDLLARGVRKVDIAGLPEQEIAIQVPTDRLHELGMTLNEIAAVVDRRSQDLPAGTAGRSDGARQIRSLSQARETEAFAELPLVTQADGRLVRLGDVARIERRPQDNQTYLEFQQRPAVELILQRTENDDTLKAAHLLHQWLEEVRPTLPEGVELTVYNERWNYLQDRINLLLKNGLGGLILVVAMLFLFLNVRVAFWVTMGIPVSFLATLAILHLIGGSINLISLFGMIMALGIIVDDAIVVGEDTLAHVQQGEPGVYAAIGGAQRMLAPVMASSLTTISAFLPLLLVGGTIGNILIDIPTVVICVIIASLVECFLILPGHLHHSLKRADKVKPGRLRAWLDKGFNDFKEHGFRRLVKAAIRLRWVTFSTALASLILAVGLVAGGRVPFTFFPVVDGDVLTASVQFTAGTEPRRVDDFLDRLEAGLYEAEEELGGGLVESVIQHQRRSLFERDSAAASNGDEYGALFVQLVNAEQRNLPNETLLARWREKLPQVAGLERLSITQQSGGPPGKPIEIKLAGGTTDALKSASLELQALLKRYTGVSNVDDDLPYGKEQWIYALTGTGKAAGLDLETVGRRLRAAFDGQLVQIFYDQDDEVEVRVILPDSERDHLATLDRLPILLPNGDSTPLSNVVEFRAKRGLDTLKRIDGQLALVVSADVDDKAANANQIIDELRAGPLQEITGRYGVQASFEGKKADERETLADMKTGLVIALALIYIILAWVFSSYSWPLTVMAAIPLGLTGAIIGHLVMGKALTILSLFGLFGLSGIVINDSIVLITFYRKLREKGMEVEEAIVEAACQRLRAVLLTSLTTIAGLSPILFETSLQAQFLIPMATSIVFGLAFATLLILLVVPSLLYMLENAKRMLGLKGTVTAAAS